MDLRALSRLQLDYGGGSSAAVQPQRCDLLVPGVPAAATAGRHGVPVLGLPMKTAVTHKVQTFALLGTASTRARDRHNKPFHLRQDPSQADTTNPIHTVDDEPQPQPVSLRKCGLRNVYVNGGLHVSWISCDGKVFAAGGGDKHMTLYDVLTGDKIGKMPCGNIMRAGAASPALLDESTGEFLFAVGSESGHAGLISYVATQSWKDGAMDGAWEATSKVTCEGQGSVNAVAFSKDGALLAVGWIQGTVHIYETATKALGGKPKKTLKLPKGKVNSGCLCFSQNYLMGSSIFMNNNDPSEVKLWNVKDGFRVERTLQYASPVWAVAMAPGEAGFAVGTEDGAVRLYSSMEDQTPWPMIPAGRIGTKGKVGPVSSLKFTFGRNPTLLAVGWRSGDFAVFDIDTVAQIASFLHAGTNNGFALNFSADDSIMAAGGGNAEVTLHRLRACVSIHSAI